MPLFVTHLIKIIFNYINELGSNGIFFQGKDIYGPSMWGAVLQVLPGSSPNLEVDLNCITHTQMRETEDMQPLHSPLLVRQFSCILTAPFLCSYKNTSWKTWFCCRGVFTSIFYPLCVFFLTAGCLYVKLLYIWEYFCRLEDVTYKLSAD